LALSISGFRFHLTCLFFQSYQGWDEDLKGFFMLDTFPMHQRGEGE